MEYSLLFASSLLCCMQPPRTDHQSGQDCSLEYPNLGSESMDTMKRRPTVILHYFQHLSCDAMYLCALLLILLPSSLAQTSAAVPVGAKSTDEAPGLYHSAADPRAIVTLGEARFTVLTPQLIRMEWAHDGRFEDRASFVFLNRRLPVPSFTSSVGKGKAQQVLTIKTSMLQITYSSPRNSDGRFTANNLSIDFELNGKRVRWHPGDPDTANLLGTTRTLDGSHGDKTIEPIEPGLISRDGWSVVDDSTRPLFDSADFSFTEGEKSPWPWVMQRSGGERQDWYFFGYGHDYKQAMADYVRVAGRIPLPPRFAFGSWWARYWAYRDEELDDLVRQFHEDHVPLDVLVVDMDWHPTFRENWWKPQLDQSGHELGWSGYSWNKLLFPYPEQFLKRIHDEGLKVTLNLHPASGVQPWEDRYPEMAQAMGMDSAQKQYVPFDITNKQFATNYMTILHHPLEKQGIDFWWLDWQQEGNTKTAGVNPTWWLNYVHFTDQEREGKRPLLFHRWGGLGNHRYQIGFSGDTKSDWDSLAFQPWFTATAANVGYDYWSHDIGGNWPGTIEPELYTRWVQFGAFSPILRTHTAKNTDAERRLWAFPDPYSDIMRNTFHLRYALLPYIYSEARRTYDTGVGFMRPLYYDWPESDGAYTAKSEYLFGDNMIVAPVTMPVDTATGLANKPIWLPPGEWIEWETGRHFTGPIKLQRNFSLAQIPIYVRAGAIVTMAPPMRNTSERPLDPLVLTIFPLRDAQNSSYTLYEDAGDSRAYQRGEAAWTLLRASEHGGDLSVEISPATGSYPGMPTNRGYEVCLPGDWPPESVTLNGQPLATALHESKPGWRYEGDILTTIIAVPPQPVNTSVTLRVHRSPDLLARRVELDGFAGAMTRLRESYAALNQTYPLSWSPDELIDALQTGNRLTYQPQMAGAELSHYRGALTRAIAAVRRRANGFSPEEKDEIRRTIGKDWKPEELQRSMDEYKKKTTRAAAAVADIPANQ